MTFNVLDFGAKADRVTDDAPAIQAAIDACSKAGGGRVVLEGGKHFYSGSIILKENVELYLEQVGTPVTLKPSYVFIYAKDADNIAVFGEGTIDGNAYAFVKQVSLYYVTDDFYPRPMLVYVEYYNQISFKDVIMRNAPFWTLHPAGCDDVLIWGLPILNDLNVANSDGIDPEHSTNVRFSNITCDSENGVFLSGSRGNHIEAILFEDVRVVQSQEQMAQRNVRFGSGIRTEDRGDQDFRILYAQSRPCDSAELPG